MIITNYIAHSEFDVGGMGRTILCHPCRKNSYELITKLKHLLLCYQDVNIISTQDMLFGESLPMKRVKSALKGIQNTNDPVLITGEQGTGKELLVRSIFNQCDHDLIFIKIDCPSFRNENSCLFQRGEFRNIGLLMQQNSNRIASPRLAFFLDKIDLLSKSGQSEILALLEGGFKSELDFEPEFRIIATTERVIEQLVKKNQFRSDLYHRLNVIAVNLSPLRQRKEDIPLLADYLAIKACAQMQRSFSLLSLQTIEKLCSYHWPGNIDELKRSIDRFVQTGNEEQVLPQIVPGQESGKKSALLRHAIEMAGILNSLEIYNYVPDVGKMSLKSICNKFAYCTEKRMLQRTLEATNWNRKKAAQLLNMSYKSILNKIKTYDII